MSREETSQGDIFAEVQTTPGHLLRRFQQIAVSMFLKECREYDLTPLQYAALAALSVSDPLDQVTLGGMIALDRTTISVVIRNLEARELVVRETSTRDRRSKMIRISPAGVAHRSAAFGGERPGAAAGAVGDRRTAPAGSANATRGRGTQSGKPGPAPSLGRLSSWAVGRAGI
jgi:DNA-binding MarR family transcriptional regulator